MTNYIDEYVKPFIKMIFSGKKKRNKKFSVVKKSKNQDKNTK